jgi:ABC-2 type transport system permease protein
MKLSRLLAIARKEFTHILRDPRSLGMAIAIPMLLLVLFGYALTLDVDNVPIAIWDQSGTNASRELVSGFSGSQYFSVRSYVHGYPELENLIDRGDVVLAVVIPREFAERLAARRRAPVQVIVDGSDANTATIAMGYADIVAQRYSQPLAVQRIHSTGARLINAGADLHPRMWFNADMDSKNYIIPGLIAVIMMVIAALLTSLTVAREWERGSMEQLISTPVTARELVLGKLLPYWVIGMVDVLLAVLMGEFLFHVPLRGSLPLLFGMAGLFLAGALSLGMVISIVTKTPLLASQLAMVLTFLPSFLLSDFMYAVSNMPRPIQWLTYLIPARYFVSLLKGIYLKGVGLEVLGAQALLLAVFSAAMVLLAVRKFEKRLV